jgi:hypothetical protein
MPSRSVWIKFEVSHHYAIRSWFTKSARYKI